MRLTAGKLLLILLVPVVLYGAVKALMYYKAKQTVDDIIVGMSNHAEVRYADIATDLRGAVTVSQISVQPLGYEDTIGIDAVRVSSDDPMFFLYGTVPGFGEENAPPPSMRFDIDGISLSLATDLLRDSLAARQRPARESLCADGLQIDPALLQQMGFAELHIDMGGFYRMIESSREVEFGIDMELRDIESIRLDATLADVDVETFRAGAPPQVSLGRMSMVMHVEPAFGRQVLKTCADGSEQPLPAWSAHLAERALAKLEAMGITLGAGLVRAVNDFYHEWGEFTVEARPGKPIGLLSLAFLPPEQLAQTLGLRMRLNDQPIVDTSFSWQRPDERDLAAMFGAEPQLEEARESPARPARILVRREYETIAVGDIGGYIDHRVRVKPRGQPLREGVLKRVAGGEAEVEQVLHGGKYTVYVPVAQIESLQALIQRPIESAQ